MSGNQRFAATVVVKDGDGGYWLTLGKTEKQWLLVKDRFRSLVVRRFFWSRSLLDVI